MLSCGETGWDGRNEVNEWGGNYWVDSVAGGSNQTYLYLQVSGDLIFLGRIETFIVVTKDGGAAGAAIDALLCSEPATSPPPPVTTGHAPGTWHV